MTWTAFIQTLVIMTWAAVLAMTIIKEIKGR